MPFPLPLDPNYRKELVGFWLDDVEDRLPDRESALASWKMASGIYLSLGAGTGDLKLEKRIEESRGKIG